MFSFPCKLPFSTSWNFTLKSFKNEVIRDGYSCIFFRDASFGACTYNLSLADVLSGLYKVRNFHIPFAEIHQLKNKY